LEAKSRLYAAVPPGLSARYPVFSTKGKIALDKDTARDWIENWEGRRNHVYLDSHGHPTIGIGFNLDRADAREKIEDLGLDYDEVRAGNRDLTDDQIDQLFDADLDQAIDDAGQIISNFDSLPGARQTLVVDMIFNLGATGFSNFRRAISAIDNENWETAADEMQDSSWYHQVGRRARADVAAMRTADIETNP
jgi:GH24 family phage-related lysozyme (muramidase)